MTLEINNQAFIDGQNLIMGTKNADSPWTVDWWKLRTYLAEKYNVSKAYYFAGAYYPRCKEMYDSIKRSNYELIFRPYSRTASDAKKGNVDTDIVFEIMRKLADREEFDKVVLVSGDGDYFRMVNYLIQKEKFKKLLAPNQKRVSYLYTHKISDSFVNFLNDADIRKKIELSPDLSSSSSLIPTQKNVGSP